MATKTAAARTLTYDTLRRFEDAEDVVREVSMAKLFTQRTLVEIADEAVQIHGGYGYMKEYEVERALRDARLGPIGGGTDEIMKEIIGKTFSL
jgi:acyl-CoA dehydrogenase